MISTVIFDLDDTPYDEIDFCRGGFRAAALHIAALSDAHSVKAVLDTLCKCFITGDCGSTFDLALAELGIPCDGPLIHKLVEVYVADNETKGFIAPDRLGLLTIRLLRPSGLYRQPSSLADAAPSVKIGVLNEPAGVLAQFVKCP